MFIRPDQTKMRVNESRNSRSRLTANSHQLSCTLINFELVQILRRVNERFGSFDRSWELHEINGLHFAVTWAQQNGRCFLASVFLTLTEEKPEASDFQVITHNKKKTRRKKENIITYHWQVTVGVMTRTVSSLTNVKKRRKRSVEATSKNKEIEKRRKTLVNSHATLAARLTEQWELRKHSCKLSPANSHPRLIQALQRSTLYSTVVR